MNLFAFTALSGAAWGLDEFQGETPDPNVEMMRVRNACCLTGFRATHQRNDAQHATPGSGGAVQRLDHAVDLVLISSEIASAVPAEELVGARVVLLAAGKDVIDQVGAALRANPGTTVVRLISHGEPGSLLVAGQRLNAESLARRADAIAGWRKHLAPAAEILLYGCAVAATPEGRSFVDAIAALTGAKVAASTTPTGSAGKGGDLRLDYATGPIKAITERFDQAWDQSGLILAAPVFTSAGSAEFTRTVAATFAVSATGSPTYSIGQATLFSDPFTSLAPDWTLANSAQISNGALTLNPATSAVTDGSLILPKLGASSPGSFTASFDYTVANVSLTNSISGTSFNYGAITSSSGSATGMVGSNGLVVSFLETTINSLGTTVPSSVEVRWNGTLIGKAPVTLASGAKPVQIKLDGANRLSVSYDGSELINMDLAGKVNAADRSAWQFALGAKNGGVNLSSHTVDNLAIVTNGVMPAGLLLNADTGVISGTPTAANSAGQQIFNLVATNADGATSQQFKLNLASGTPVFNSPSSYPTLPGVPTTIAVSAVGSAGPTTYSISPKALFSATLADSVTLPTGVYTNGSARFNAGALELTQNSNNQIGSVQFPGQSTLNPSEFSASFDYKVGDGTAVRGGGISFNYGPPGLNTKGLRVDISEYKAGPPATNATLTVTVSYDDSLVCSYQGLNTLTANTFAPIRLTMSAEGRPQVWVNNALLLDNSGTPGSFDSKWQNVDKSLWAFSITGTTGTANNNFKTVKNLVIGTNSVLPPGLSLNPTTGVISGQLGLGTAVDPYVNITATNAAGSTTQLLKLDVSASNTLPGQRPASGTSLGGDNSLGVTGEQFRNLSAFAALTTDGQVKVWGNTANGGLQSDAPTGTGYTLITSTEKAFAALKNDGSIVSWGFSGNGATGEPTGTGYQMLAASRSAFAAIKSDGSITAWGDSANGGLQRRQLHLAYRHRLPPPLRQRRRLRGPEDRRHAPGLGQR